MDSSSCSSLLTATGASSSSAATTQPSAAATLAAAAVAPEKKQPPKHPLLRRHFFTIGIGDCFVQPPLHPLPSVYLSSSSSSTSSSRNVDGNGRHFVTAAAAAVVHNFESTELVAAIKSTPQDFVVREIGLPHRIISGLNEEQVESSMRVASLEGLPDCSSISTTSSSSGNDQPTFLLKRFKEVQAVDSRAVVDGEGGSGKNNEKLSQDTARGTPRQQHDDVRVTNDKVQQPQQTNTAEQAVAGQSEDEAKEAGGVSVSSFDPVTTLQKFLPCDDVDELSTSTAAPRSSSLDDLSRLQADAVNWIQKRSSSSSIGSSSNNPTAHDVNKDDDTDNMASRSVVVRPLLNRESTTSRLERGEFHTALRLAFPMLKVESAETKPPSSSCISDARSSDCNSRNDSSADIPTSSHLYYQVKVIADDSFFELVPYLYEPHVDLPRLYQFLRNRQDSGDDQQVSSQSNTLNGNNINNQSRRQRLLYLRLRPDLDRSQRRPVHQIIDSKSGRSLSTETLPTFALHPDEKDCTLVTAAIVVSWSKTAQRRACKNENKKRKRGSWTKDIDQQHDYYNDTANVASSAVDPSPNILFILKKTQIEHLAAIQLLSKALHCRQADVGLSGIKDMQAVTYQFCSIRNGSTRNHSMLRQARGFLQSRGVELSRNVYKVDWFLQKGALQGNRFEIVLRNVRRIQVSQPTTAMVATESFFPCDADYIQEAVRRIETHGILNFYGEQRVGAAGEEAIVGTRALDIGRAMLQQNYARAIDLIMTGRLLCKGGTESERDEVRRVRQTWKESGGDPFATWKVLPPCESSLLLRERLVLRGLKRYGTTEPLAALKCLQYNERVFWIQAYQSYVFNRALTERVERYGCSQVVKGDLVRSRQEDGDSSRGSYGEPPVVIVTESNLTDYSIEDVVLPLPGYNSIYPTNKVGRLYQAILEADKIVFRKDALPETTARGSYRYLRTSVTNVKSEILSRDDSGLDLRIWFDLPAGSYATMVLRELMRTTVSRSIGDITAISSIESPE